MCEVKQGNGKRICSWWRHQMDTISALLALCVCNSPVPGEFHRQRPVTRSFDVFFDLRLNKRSSKQSWGWWFETPASSLWRHCDVMWSYYQCCDVTKSQGSHLYLTKQKYSSMDKLTNAASSLDSPTELQYTALFAVGLNKLLNKQSSCRWFETPCAIVLYYRLSIYRSHILHDDAHKPTITMVKLRPHFAFTNATRYVALTGEL